MKSVGAEFENAAGVTQVYLDYGELRNDFRVPIQFTVVNRGVDPIGAIEIELSPRQCDPKLWISESAA